MTTLNAKQIAEAIDQLSKDGQIEPGTYEAAAGAFKLADHAVHAGYPVKLYMDPEKPWTIIVKPKP